MSENIRIENFAGLEEISLEFKRLNIFIGPQASGKSVIIKLTYFFKEFFSDLINSIPREENLHRFKASQVDKFIKFFPKNSWRTGTFNIEYELNKDIKLCMRKDKDGDKKPKLEFSEELLNSINKTKKFYKHIISENQKKDDIVFSRRMEMGNKLNEEFFKNVNKNENLFNGEQFFIPAGRSFFSNLQESIFSFLKENTILDPFLIEFGSNYETFKNIFYRHERNINHDIDNIISSILNSEYKREKNIDSLIHKDSRIVNLSNASSGQQEILPLLIILRVLITGRIRLGRGNNYSSIYIEEPEAHLFPNAQKAIVRLLARLCNMDKYQVFITTHSPYLLSSINNHFIAGTIDDENIKSHVYNIINENELLFAEESTAYSLKNGKCDDLISKEDNIILAEVLDNVSNDIASDFDKLLSLKYES